MTENVLYTFFFGKRLITVEYIRTEQQQYSYFTTVLRPFSETTCGAGTRKGANILIYTVSSVLYQDTPGWDKTRKH